MASQSSGAGFNGVGFGSDDDQIDLAQVCGIGGGDDIRVQVTLTADLQPLCVEVAGMVFPAGEDGGFNDGAEVACEQAAYGASSDNAGTINLCHLEFSARMMWQALLSSVPDHAARLSERLVFTEEQTTGRGGDVLAWQRRYIDRRCINISAGRDPSREWTLRHFCDALPPLLTHLVPQRTR